VSLIRTSLPIFICLCDLLSAAALDHPLYFEERSSELFETRAAGKLVAIRTASIELDGVTFQFANPSKSARLEGIGTPAPSTYITRGETRTLAQYPKARIRCIYPGIDVAFYGTPGSLEYDLDLARGAAPGRIRINVSGARKVTLVEHGNLIVELGRTAPAGAPRVPNPARYAQGNRGALRAPGR
jgi:hypothetical protein